MAPEGSLITRLTPEAAVASPELTKVSNWTWKADYNYYSYGEESPIGPTLPRNFRGNVYTLAVQYAF